jgi:hypothetical protein
MLELVSMYARILHTFKGGNINFNSTAKDVSKIISSGQEERAIHKPLHFKDGTLYFISKT